MLRKFISVIMLALPLTSWGWGSGFYVGGGLGADAVDFYDETYIKQPPSAEAFSVINTIHQSAQGIFGSVFGGYSWIREAFYIGIEGNFNGSTSAFKTTNQEFDHATKTRSYAKTNILPNWGVSFLPGWLLLQDTTLIYGRFGYAGGIFHVTTTDSSLTNVNHVISGIRYGIGIEKRLYQHFGIRLEYNHIMYQGTTSEHFDISSGAPTYKQSVITPQTNQFELGFVYRFC